MSFLLRCWTHRDPIARTSLPVASCFCLHHVPFEVQPVYAPQEPRTELKLAGYSVSNRVRVKIQRIGRVGEVLDRLVTAGATDIANIEWPAPGRALQLPFGEVLKECRALVLTQRRGKSNV